MITKDKSIVEAKLAEMYRIEMSEKQLINVTLDDYKSADSGAVDRILVELESTNGADELVPQISTSLESVKCSVKCDVIIQLITNDLTMKELFNIQNAIQQSHLKTDNVLYGVARDLTLDLGYIRLLLVIYVKEYDS